MPETRIGFAPDAGGSWLLGRAPGRLGEYLALTSEVIGAADAIHCGLADHFVPSDRLVSLRDALEMRADPASPTELVMLFDETPDAGPLERAQPWIDDAFAADTMQEIVGRLRRLGADGVADGEELTPARALAAIEERSPTALVVSLAAIRSARVLRSQRRALQQEHDLMSWFLRTQPDMAEGIRAQLVDKDRAPRWSPATIDEVEEDIVGYAFTHRAPQLLFPVQES
jgi:enoyl-CoA hydratase